MARPIEVPVVVKKGSLARSIEGEATTAMRKLGGSSTAVQPLGRMLGKIRADADEFTKSIEASNARVIAFGASVGVINGISNAFKSLVTTTIKVEKSMADINIVLGASEKTLAKFGDGLFKVAKNTAQSFDVVTEAATEFARQGLSVEETLKRTNDALILTRLTGLKAADSVKGLTAAVNGFGKAGLTTTQIINKLSAVDVKFAVGTDDLINALGRAGAVAQDAGVSFDELVALVTVAQQKTARGGAVIGNAFKTIYTRMQDPKALNALRQVGVAVDDVRGAALPANRVLQNLAQTYDSLNRSQKATIDQFVAGKFQINILKSVLGDLNTVNNQYVQAQQVSINATDQAIQKNETLNKTMAALATQSGLALDELAKKVGDLSLGPGMRNILQSFNALVEGATKGLDGEGTGSSFAKGLLRGIGGVLTGPGLFIIGGVFIKLFKDLTVFGVKSLKNLLGLNNASKQQAALQQGIGQLLSTNLKFQTAMAAAEGNIAKQAAITQRFLASEVVLRERAAAASAKLAAAAYAGGFGVSAAGMVTRGRSRGRAPSFAPTGGVPNFAKILKGPGTGNTYDVGQLPGSITGGGGWDKPMTTQRFLKLAKFKSRSAAGGLTPLGHAAQNYFDEKNITHITGQAGKANIPFSGPKDAKSFYKAVFSQSGPSGIDTTGVYERGQALMKGKNSAFANDPVGAFYKAVDAVHPVGAGETSNKTATKIRTHFARGPFEAEAIKRMGGEAFKHSNFIIDAAQGGRPREVKALISEATKASIIGKQFKMDQDVYDKAPKYLKTALDQNIDRIHSRTRVQQLSSVPGSLEQRTFGAGVGRLAFRGRLRGFASNLAPNFSPLSDAVQREKAQVGSMMGISPSSVQTRVVQNTALKSPFNPQGFGVISPTVGQNSFADAARMHKGEDLRTTNLPNFAFGDTFDPKTGKMTGPSFDKVTDPGAKGPVKVEVSSYGEAAKKGMTDAYVKSGAAPAMAAFGAHRRAPYEPMAAPPSWWDKTKSGVKSRTATLTAGAKGIGSAAMGPGFTGMFAAEMAGGFMPQYGGAGLEGILGMTPEQRQASGRGRGALMGGIYGATGAGMASSVLKGMGKKLHPAIAVGATVAGAGIGYGRGGERDLTPDQLMGAASLQQEKVDADIQNINLIRQGITTMGGMAPDKKEETLHRMQAVLGKIKDPTAKADLNQALANFDVAGIDKAVTGLMQRREGESAAYTARAGIGRAGSVGFSKTSVQSTAQALKDAGINVGDIEAMQGFGKTGLEATSGIDGTAINLVDEFLRLFGQPSNIGTSVGEGMEGTPLKDKLNLAEGELAGFVESLADMQKRGDFEGLITAFESLKDEGKELSSSLKVAAWKMSNVYQDFEDIGSRMKARARDAEIQSALFPISESIQGARESQGMSVAARIGGARSTIGMRKTYGIQAADRNLKFQRGQMMAQGGLGLGKIAIPRTPGANLALMEAIESSLEGGNVRGMTAMIEKAQSTKMFDGDTVQIGVEEMQSLLDWSRALENSSEILDKTTEGQKEYIRVQAELAKDLDKNGVLIAGIEGFRNSLQDAFMSIADPSLSGGDIARNFAMGILGSIQQQASSNVADFVSDSLFGDLFKKKDKQSGGIINAQNGMYISGGRSGDKNPAMLEDGEYVLNRNAVKMMGGGKAIDAINFGMAPRFAGGGVFSGVPSKHRKKALEKFGYSSFGPSTGGSALGGGGMSLGLDYFDPRLSSLAHANDPTLQAMRGIFREEKQKDIAEKFQKQANNDALVQKVVGAAVSAGLSYGVGKIGAKMKDSKLEKQALADESEVFAEGFDFSPIASLPTAPTGGAPARPGTVLGGRIQGETLKRFGFLGPVTAPQANVYTKMAGHIEKGASLGEAMRLEGLTTSGSQGANTQNTGTGMAGMSQQIRNQISTNRGIAPHEKGFGRVSKNDQMKLRVGALRDLGGSTGITPYPEMVGKTSGINLGSLGAAVGRAPSLLGRGLSAGFGALEQMSRNMYDKLNPMILAPDGSRPTRAMDSVYSSSQGYIGEKGGKFYILQQHESGQWGHSDAQLFMNKSTLMNSFDGRKIPGYQRGGSIDNIPAMLTGGEFVVNAGAVKKYGSNTLNNMNRFQTGGMVGSQKFVPGEDSSSKKQAISEPSTNNNTVNISINPGGGASVNANEDFSGTSTNSANQNRELGRKIKNAVLEVIQTEKRIGGSLRNPYAKEQ